MLYNGSQGWAQAQQLDELFLGRGHFLIVDGSGFSGR